MSTPLWPKIRGSLSRLLIWVLLLTVWEAAYRAAQWRPDIFPAPSFIADSLLGMLGIDSAFSEPLHPGWPRLLHPAKPPTLVSIARSELVAANVVSALRLVVGFALSLLLGAALGLAMWRWVALDEFLGPLFLGVQTLPSVCWVPLAYLLIGLNEYGILFVLVMGSAFGISLSMRDGLRTIPPLYRRAGLMLGAGGWRLYRYVMFPASLPALASSLRSGFSFAWRSLMGAEMLLIVDHRGLGYLLTLGENNADIAKVMGVVIVMIIIGMVADRLAFAPLEKKVHARFGLAVG